MAASSDAAALILGCCANWRTCCPRHFAGHRAAFADVAVNPLSSSPRDRQQQITLHASMH